MLRLLPSGVIHLDMAVDQPQVRADLPRVTEEQALLQPVHDGRVVRQVLDPDAQPGGPTQMG